MKNDQMVRYYIFFIFIFYLTTVVSSRTHLSRNDHTASYLDDKIYFLGGETDYACFTSDFFYLDVSKPFDILLGSDLLPIVDLTNLSQIPKHARATSTICGPNKDTIFLFGGEIEKKDITEPSVFAFNVSNPGWTEVNSSGTTPIRRRWSAGACGKNAKMYIFGGTTVDPFSFRNDFDILDTINLTWSVGYNSKIPPPMDVATATLLPDGRIIYLGGNGVLDGVMPLEMVSMSKIHIYDTDKDEWTTMKTDGTPPTPRGLHTAILTQDGRIIVYGGGNLQGPPPDQLSVLDTTKQTFKWSIPVVKYTPRFMPFMKHTATLVGNYMIVAFGVFRHGTKDFRSNKFHMLDISDKNNYRWVTKFVPNPTVTLPTPVPTNTPPPPTFSLFSFLIGVAIIIAIIAIIAVVVIFFYKRNMRGYVRIP